MTTPEPGFLRERALPVATILAALVVLWYGGTVWLNAQPLIDRYEREGRAWQMSDLVADAMRMDRPILPAPHQVLAELGRTVLAVAPDSPRSLVYHGWVTLSAALLGFVVGALLGIALAVGIIHLRTLERSLMPWVIASQTVPILAIAPMIIVVLGNLGLVGIVPKGIISAYLCFFPVTIGMVKGLNSPDPIHLDLVRTYSANRFQIFVKLRWPSALPFLFPSLKVAVALAIVGAIVGELPTGAQAGLGARLLTGSYYGQTVQIWAALIGTAVLSSLSIVAVGAAERLTVAQMGGRP